MSRGFAHKVIITGSVCLAALVMVYFTAVRTITGQRFEDAVLRASDGRRSPPLVGLLDSITGWSVAALVILVVVIGLLRGLPHLGLAAGAVIVGSVVTAEVMRGLLTRPILLTYGYRREDQSFPSGHTAVAVSVMCALMMVVPYRRRGVTALLASLWAVGVGALTVTVSWHRPSDTLGSDLIVLLYVCAAVLTLAWSGSVRSADPGRGAARITGKLPGVVLAIAAGTALCVTAVLGHQVMRALAATPDPGELRLGAALIAGRAITLAGGALTCLTVLALLRAVDLRPPSGAAAGHALSRRAGPPTEPMSPQTDHAH